MVICDYCGCDREPAPTCPGCGAVLPRRAVTTGRLRCGTPSDATRDAVGGVSVTIVAGPVPSADELQRVAVEQGWGAKPPMHSFLTRRRETALSVGMARALRGRGA